MILFSVRDTPLDVAEAIAAVSHPGAGAVDVFLGLVRDTNEGRTVVRLEYEAYATMAVKEMERIAAALVARWPGVRLAAQHRVGSLTVGELAVVCVASAPHRTEAFVACRALIDGIKARVPVWKREWGSDGPYWIHWEDARCPPNHGAQDPVHAHPHADHHHGCRGGGGGGACGPC